MIFAKAPLRTPNNDLIIDPEPTPGILGRLGAWSVAHKRRVFLSWLLIVVVLGIFAPNVEKALSGAGWQADGSQSVAVRQLAQKDFGGQASSAIEVVIHDSQR
jgi:RND superfamily putative drug exporter